MTITITKAAGEWFRRELELPAKAGVRFFGKVYGQTNVHDGFSVGIARDDSLSDPIVETALDGITYYVDANDAWFFDGLDLAIDYDAHRDEPTYTFIPEAGSSEKPRSDATSGASEH
ncbi:HesB/YadR/YfhF family protein [Lacticaseibacillus baoqingensis]|uniref:HesB/YadR/YfhF family protein n=1 Tax=Lacticaseibacillus baoqingensis TaxID=2486013 RepID=A0ABW4E901_9LACO|nr:iron-sulfur cluster biosynthesis protein [Lacticaseibacillus baoqingensis]